jgi:hypothetical protein
MAVDFDSNDLSTLLPKAHSMPLNVVGPGFPDYLPVVFLRVGMLNLRANFAIKRVTIVNDDALRPELSDTSGNPAVATRSVSCSSKNFKGYY